MATYFTHDFFDIYARTRNSRKRKRQALRLPFALGNAGRVRQNDNRRLQAFGTVNGHQPNQIGAAGLGLAFYFGASQFRIAKILQGVGGIWLGIALVVTGVLMLDVIKPGGIGLGRLTKKLGKKEGKKNYLDAFGLGLLFALAFCPYSGVLYFGGLIPMTIASPSGLLLPPIFAIATSLPVIVIAWLVAYSIGNIGKFYNKMNIFQKWFKRIAATVFIAVGAYYLIINI